MDLPQQKSLFKNSSPWLVISLILHLLLFWLAILYAKTPTVLDPLEVELFAENRETKQIVDIPELAPKEKPKDTKYLSHNNQRVEKETKAPRQKPNPWQNAIAQNQLNKNQKADAESDPDGLAKKQSEESGSISETDFLPEIPLSDKTYINAEEFKHTRYYLEIKRKIEITWNPYSALRSHQGISISRGMLATYLGVTLTQNGELDHLAVLSSSGIDALDEEAKRSFYSSAPFTKVPRELLSPDGKLRFEFGFIVYRR